MINLSSTLNMQNLNRVNIHRKSRVWQFNLTLEKPLPVDVYTVFSQRINETFSAIATVKFKLHVRNHEVDEQLIQTIGRLSSKK